MKKSEMIGSEITVRISLTFQQAPAVHTLLAMTPVRERGKIVQLALERYIAATDHPAGNVDVQIEAVSEWLRNRATGSATMSITRIDSSQVVSSPLHEIRQEKNGPALQIDESESRGSAERGNERQQHIMNTTSSEMESSSIRRWLAY